jgi:hypothetical protein
LYLNVFSPVNKTELLPVIFSIHGGGFVAGNANSGSFSNLIKTENFPNVIVVTPQVYSLIPCCSVFTSCTHSTVFLCLDFSTQSLLGHHLTSALLTSN